MPVEVWCAKIAPQIEEYLKKSKVLNMCLDKFLLAVESRDLSQADKTIVRVSSLPFY